MSARPRTFALPAFGKRYVSPENSNRANRPSAAKRGYDRKWRMIRAVFLKKHPDCVGCNQPATEVDHIISLRKGGSNAWGNLRPYCKRCDSAKTYAVDGSLRSNKNRSQSGS